MATHGHRALVAGEGLAQSGDMAQVSIATQTQKPRGTDSIERLEGLCRLGLVADGGESVWAVEGGMVEHGGGGMREVLEGKGT